MVRSALILEIYLEILMLLLIIIIFHITNNVANKEHAKQPIFLRL